MPKTHNSMNQRSFRDPPVPASGRGRRLALAVAAAGILLAALGAAVLVRGRDSAHGWLAHRDEYCFAASSDSYGPLYDWLRHQPATSAVDIEWRKPCITVIYTRPAARGSLDPPWAALGYPAPLRVAKSAAPAPAPATSLYAVYGVLGLFVAALVVFVVARASQSG